MKGGGLIDRSILVAYPNPSLWEGLLGALEVAGDGCQFDVEFLGDLFVGLALGVEGFGAGGSGGGAGVGFVGAFAFWFE